MTNRVLKRVPDWWDRLKETVARHEGLPWVWGSTDCACFGAACVEAITGHDVLGTLRGAYTSRLTALGRIRGHGYHRIPEAVAGFLTKAGAVEIEPQFAQCGDIELTRGEVICVRMPAGFIARREKGELAIAMPIRAWAIGWE
jgi:Domain of unknown function (DUF6950)